MMLHPSSHLDGTASLQHKQLLELGLMKEIAASNWGTNVACKFCCLIIKVLDCCNVERVFKAYVRRGLDEWMHFPVVALLYFSMFICMFINDIDLMSK